VTGGTGWVRRIQLLWADPQHVFDLLCAKAGRNLSLDEWRTYIGADEPWRPTCPHWRSAEAPTQDPADRAPRRVLTMSIPDGPHY
jgi:hypothetical protein